MKQLILFLQLIFILLFITCADKESQIEQIIRLENMRVACDSLSIFLKSTEPKIRARAVEAMGKLQDTSCVRMLISMLKDPNHNVRLETAFALGQLGHSDSEAALLDRLNAKEVTEVKTRVVEALGKIGTERSFPILIRLFKSENSNIRSEAALSAGRMALRNITNQAMTTSLITLLKDKDNEVRWKACYSLMRISKGLQPEPLREAITDPDPRVRMYAIQTLGKLKDVPILESFGLILRSDPDWRVRVKVANALGNYPLHLVANYFSLLHQQTHVRRAILQAIGASAMKEPEGYNKSSREHNLAKHQLEEILTAALNTHELEKKDSGDYSEIATALISYAQLMKNQGIEFITEFSRFGNLKIQAKAMQALGETRATQALSLLEKSYAKAPTIVKIAILEAFTKIGKFTNPRLFLTALKENDHVLVALAANGLSQDTLNNRIYTIPIIEAYQKLPKPLDPESEKMIIQAMMKIDDKRIVPILEEVLKTPDKTLSRFAANALEKITGDDYSSKIVQYTQAHTDFHYDDITNLTNAKAYIKTNRGNIEIKLYTMQAPLTVLNFVKLAEKGFYDRLTFHRVVPNFVIQGGDPRGDSWGSPGYSIRSEFNKHPYLRGTVGMASAGKDTEGCQFFITHSEQPHLDGRYTVFGQVTAGMEVVDVIQEGDVMELVSIQR